MTPLPIVAVVGRPNVGKSTFFNRVVGHRAAIVEDRARTTRDRIYGEAEWNGRRFIAVDTGGLEIKPGDPIEEKVQEQARIAIAEADIIVLVVDSITGLTPAPRQDRAVYQFASRGRELEITLPERTAADQICVTLDGKRVTPPATADGRLIIPLAADGGANRHLLDLRKEPAPQQVELVFGEAEKKLVLHEVKAELKQLLGRLRSPGMRA